jgi:hypothetical protein
MEIFAMLPNMFATRICDLGLRIFGNWIGYLAAVWTRADARRNTASVRSA